MVPELAVYALKPPKAVRQANKAKHTDKTALSIFGKIDAMKFCSCLTLFHLASPDEELFTAALKQFFDGQMDDKTLQFLVQTKRRR